MLLWASGEETFYAWSRVLLCTMPDQLDTRSPHLTVYCKGSWLIIACINMDALIEIAAGYGQYPRGFHLLNHSLWPTLSPSCTWAVV